MPGDRIVFEDDFSADHDGEFPAHWKLLKGHAVVNKFQDQPTFALTEGNYVEVAPRLSANKYLTIRSPSDSIPFRRPAASSRSS